MTQLSRIQAARALLETVTPLKGDCGRLCAAACCQPDADGQGGMVLFPGEESLYDPAPEWATISDSAFVVDGQPLRFLTCGATCPRENRPLACRIFPLTPIATQDGFTLALDVRAWPVCPLMGHGMAGLSRDFVAAAHAAMALLWEDEACRAYIALLTGQLQALQSFGG